MNNGSHHLNVVLVPERRVSVCLPGVQEVVVHSL